MVGLYVKIGNIWGENFGGNWFLIFDLKVLWESGKVLFFLGVCLEI